MSKKIEEKHRSERDRCFSYNPSLAPSPPLIICLHSQI